MAMSLTVRTGHGFRVLAVLALTALSLSVALAQSSTPQFLMDNGNSGQIPYSISGGGGNPTILHSSGLASGAVSSSSVIRIPDGLSGIPNKSFYYVYSAGFFPVYTTTLLRFHINTATNTLIQDVSTNMTSYGGIGQGTPAVDSAGTLYYGTTGGIVRYTIGGTVTYWLNNISGGSYGTGAGFQNSSAVLNGGKLYIGSSGASGQDTYMVALDTTTMALSWYWRPTEKDFSPAGPSGFAAPVVANESGTTYIYSAGGFVTSGSITRYSVVKLTTSGGLVWEDKWNQNTVGRYGVGGLAVTIGPAGHLYVPSSMGYYDYLPASNSPSFSNLSTSVYCISYDKLVSGNLVMGTSSSVLWRSSGGTTVRNVTLSGAYGKPITLDSLGTAFLGAGTALKAIYTGGSIGSTTFMKIF